MGVLVPLIFRCRECRHCFFSFVHSLQAPSRRPRVPSFRLVNAQQSASLRVQRLRSKSFIAQSLLAKIFKTSRNARFFILAPRLHTREESACGVESHRILSLKTKV